MISRQSFKLKIQTRLLRIHGSQELHAFFTNMLQSQVFLMGKYPLDVFQKKKRGSRTFKYEFKWEFVKYI